MDMNENTVELNKTLPKNWAWRWETKRLYRNKCRMGL